jgi:hypothetical protein
MKEVERQQGEDRGTTNTTIIAAAAAASDQCSRRNW